MILPFLEVASPRFSHFLAWPVLDSGTFGGGKKDGALSIYLRLLFHTLDHNVIYTLNN